MRTSSSKLSIFALFGVCAGLCAVPARSFAGSPTPNSEAQLRLCSFTHDHAYLYTPQGPVDVTNTIYTSQGVTYVVYQDASIAVILDYTHSTIYDTSGAVVGFIRAVVEISTVAPRSIHNNESRRNSRTLRYQMPVGRPTRNSKSALFAQARDLT